MVHQELRVKILEIMRDKKWNYEMMAADMVMPKTTLFYFIRMNSKPQLRTLHRVEEYFKQQGK